MVAVVSTTMVKEEQDLLEAREKSDALREQELLRKRQQDIAAGPAAIDKKFKALEFLLGKSQVR
jgi:ATP-dependent DNA helicase